MITLTPRIQVQDWEIQYTATTSQGPGGQNVNKVSTAIQLRFDISKSTLSSYVKSRLLSQNDSRITSEGVFTVKAQSFRSQEKNKLDAIQRLCDFVENATKIERVRKATKPTRSSKVKRTDSKKKRGQTKALRNKPRFND